MAELAALIPPLQKRARRHARFRAVPSWATPNEIHGAWMVLRRQSRSSGAVAPRCRHAWLGTRFSRAACKKKEGLPNCFRTAIIHNHQKRRRGPRLSQVYQFAGWRRQDDLWRMAGAHRGPLPSLAVWLCSQSRGYRLPGYPFGHLGACCKSRLVPKRIAVGHCQGLRHVGQRVAFPRCDRSKCPLRQRRPAGLHAHQKGRLLDSNGGASGRQLGPRPLPTKLRCCYSRVE